ncbi:Bug family tripartite tricarboxylate transporter substrate binding protein [Zwartia vadi]|uniref:Bug family tripartite tricarboxylate transporter substrate binding protein n=1 Tax=Zwartia vadi TaxID=3058168 RepID=UPI0025B4120D|nr:tripartite tricarboxylate transporter substrate binding protein [Zwartia vadi]MDN3986229.1 tripartite tricarboxylate transporter substrate binding protein [Zwartia vadi]
MTAAPSKFRRLLLLTLGFGAISFGWATHAQVSSEWPTKPLRFVVPYPPGGPLDTIARVLAEQVKPTLGQPVIVENRPGAGGNIGADLIAKAQPDGYSLVMGAVATHAINPSLYSKIPYDAVRDFAPVALVASVPNVLIVNKEFADKQGIRTMQDLVRYALAHPGKLNYGSGGSGSAGHLAGELLAARTQMKAVHIPYQGAAPAKLALLSGQSEFMFDNLASAASLIKEGKVVALAVTTDKRSDVLPEVPTVQETGIKPFDIGTWFGVFTTGGTPPAVVDKLYQAYTKALADPAVQTRLKQMGSNATTLTPAQFAEMVAQERQKYQELVKLSGAKVD